jgi:hypothetical protein
MERTKQLAIRDIVGASAITAHGRRQLESLLSPTTAEELALLS